MNPANVTIAPLPTADSSALSNSFEVRPAPEVLPPGSEFTRNEVAVREVARVKRPGSRVRKARRPALKVERWLGKALDKRWESYRERLKECRESPSEESVHELRVSIRRLISQIILLDCILPGGKSERALRMLKRQLKALGPLRDHHVQRMFLLQQSARFPELLILRAYFDRRERKLIKTTSRKVGRFRVKKLGKGVRGIVWELTHDADEAARQKQLIALAVRRAGEAFGETVGRLQAIDYSVLSTIHRTRVAFKKFRYIVESLPSEVSGLTKQDLRNLAWYQRKMGNIQDLEVIQVHLMELIQEQKGLKDLLTSFGAYLRRRRARALLSFRKSAHKLTEFWPPRGQAHSLPARVNNR